MQRRENLLTVSHGELLFEYNFSRTSHFQVEFKADLYQNSLTALSIPW